MTADVMPAAKRARGVASTTQRRAGKPGQFDRSIEDLGNVIALEHVNVRVPDQGLATLFYVSGQVMDRFGRIWSAVPSTIGLGLGMLTYRIRSFWPAVVLHLGTGAIILLTILLRR